MPAPTRLPIGMLWSAAAVAALAVWATDRLVKATTPGPPADGPSLTAFPEPPQPFLRQWCYDCHGDGASKGGLAMDGPQPLTARDWDNIRRHVLLRTMPPQDKPVPPPEARDGFEEALLAWQAAQPAPSPSPPFRRLSRREFAHSLKDLTGTAPDLTALPDDESAHGFDNNGDFQPLPPAVLERYVSVIQDTLQAALLPAPVLPKTRRFVSGEFDGPGGLSPDAPDFYEVETGAPVRIPMPPATAGSYRITLHAYAHQAGEGPVQVSLMESPPQSVRAISQGAPDLPQTRVDLPAGATALTFRLVNPLQDPGHPDPHRRARRLLVREVMLEGPLDGDATPSAAFGHRFGPVPAAPAPLAARLDWAADRLDAVVRRAWRRPPSVEESDRLTGLAGQALARSFRPDEALVTVLQAILTSPHFLFLPDPAQAPPAHRSHATGARLAYLLWSTLPDESLLAESDAPWTPQRLASAARRLLDDPRAEAFADDFAGQWLQLRNTGLSRPDPALFPESTPEHRLALQRSAGAFFLHLIRENEPVLRLLDAGYTFLPGPGGLPEKILLTDPDQRGLLGHPAVLLLTSYPNRTSPVLRGKYILETLLGLDPPPPPPNVPTLQAASPAGLPAPSVRLMLEQHRADRACASCHRAIDPLGFPLEAFDAIGRPSGAPPAELTTTTFTGTVLRRPADLSAWLIREQGERIVRHAAEQLLTFALGRGLHAAEIQTAHRLAAQCGGREARFRDLLLAIITSPVFRGENLPATKKPHF